MEVEIIKANDPFDKSSKLKHRDKLRVAAYCRVSTDDEEQLKSYNSMIKYYTDLISKNSQWEFSGVYADKSVTGTKTEKRQEFQRLIQDCVNGKIDMVIAKSISRFARNTLDTLKYVRLLREKKVAVYFEVEKINTLKDGEFLMTILSSVAQQEVENTSAYVKRGLKMKMKRGELVGFQGCLGYDYDVETKTISINPEGAEVVKYIFDRYCAGAGSSIIAKELNEQGILTIRGNRWTSSTVMGVINNEKYKGDILMGKTFTVDPISKRRLDNLGEEDRFYIRNHHEPIISEEIFEKAQEIRNRRNGGRNTATPGKREKYSRQYAFSCMMECGFCGHGLSRRRWHSNSKYKKVIWQCVKSTKSGKRYCPDSKGIPEDVIELAFIESYRMLCADNKSAMEEFLKRVEQTLLGDTIKKQIKELDDRRIKIKNKRKVLLDKYISGLVEEDVYSDKDIELKKELTDTTAKLEYLIQQKEDERSLEERIKEFKTVLAENQVLEEFDRGIFESIIEKVIIGGYDDDGNKDPYKITFIYKTGFTNHIDNAKKKYGKKGSKITDKKENLPSYASDKIKDVLSNNSDDAGRSAYGEAAAETSHARKKKLVQDYARKKKAEQSTMEDFREEIKDKRKREQVHREQKKSSRLSFGDEDTGMVRGAGMGISKKAASAAAGSAAVYVHGKAHEAEEENAALEGSHRAELMAENALRYAMGRTSRGMHKRSARLKESSAVQMEKGRLLYETSQEMGKKAAQETAKAEQARQGMLKRFWQKRQYKKAYQAAKRGEKTAAGTAKATQTAVSKAKSVASKVFGKSKGILGMAAIAALFFVLIASLLSSCGASLQGGAASTIASTTYGSTDEDIYAVENAYAALESSLNSQIKKIDHSRISDVQEIAGHGVRAVIDGKTILAGNAKLMDKEGISYIPSNAIGTVIYVLYGSYLHSRSVAETATGNKRKGRFMARPKKDKALRHTHPVMLRLTDTEYELVSTHAKAAHLPLAEYSRRLVTGKQIKIKYELVADLPEIKKMTAQLGKIGSNLNQIARHFNSGGIHSQEMRKAINRGLADIYEMKYEVLKLAGDFLSAAENSEAGEGSTGGTHGNLETHRK